MYKLKMILVISFVAIAVAYYFMQKERIKKEQRRETMREKRQELLDRTIRSKMSKNPEDNNPNGIDNHPPNSY
jgi:septation ring formation regulator EzrA